MLFNSLDFLVFFGVFFPIYWILPGDLRRKSLILASMLFYAWWNYLYLFHFVAMVLFSYFCYLRVRNDKSEFFFFLGLIVNLGNLVFFKYVSTTLLWVGESTGTASLIHAGQALHFGFPLAISFYTFQLIAILVDARRGEVTEEIGFQNFLQYSFFFPHLIAGPILRHKDYFPQIGSEKFEKNQMASGIYLVMFGLLKKVVIADGISAIIDPVYANPSGYSSTAIIVALYGFALQIYADFSGYTDIARGLAKMLGYEIPENFMAPYFSYTFAELWRKWHITLSLWLRDYVFFPLGGSRVNAVRANLNIVVTMVLAGLWHGHSHMFFLWGIYIGTLMVIERMLGIGKMQLRLPTKFVFWVIMITLWSSSALFFRGHDLSSASQMIQSLLGNGGTDMPPRFSRFTGLVFLSVAVHTIQQYRLQIGAIIMKHWKWMIPLIAIVLYYMLVRIDRTGATFIYFRF